MHIIPCLPYAPYEVKGLSLVNGIIASYIVAAYPAANRVSFHSAGSKEEQFCVIGKADGEYFISVYIIAAAVYSHD